MLYSIDRFENGIAVLIDDDGNIKECPASSLPQDVKEGDVLIFDGKTYQISKDETEKRREKARKLIDALFQ